ncbi:hypothetical protein EX30DRAFT_338410 [Ascodesmis nigricans]|uniref:Uncharacterized protein n=1 Tax=Ascodesmis nigricans TaxID=341454 RepID=A0A4S2N3X5_9PEZI|nr:hypothetical protein EX30DRAFT_338410 [Ascodesmis nigricans]
MSVFRLTARRIPGLEPRPALTLADIPELWVPMPPQHRAPQKLYRAPIFPPKKPVGQEEEEVKRGEEKEKRRVV